MVESRSLPAGSPDWDARFSGDGYLFGTEPNRFLVSCRGLLGERGRVLCVADGEGRNSVWLAAQGFGVDAFDPSPVGVLKARRLAAERGVSVRFEIADVDEWRWPAQTYDAVAAIFIQFAPPPLRRQLFDRIAGALRPGGLLLLQGYRVEQLTYGTGGPPIAELLYTETQLRAELSAFTIERLVSYDAVIEEGSGHSGMSALIDVVARRPADQVAG